MTLHTLLQPDEIDKYLAALHTQYQRHGDGDISARNCMDAPNLEQLALIREAHGNIIPTLRQLRQALADIDKLAEALDNAKAYCPEEIETYCEEALKLAEKYKEKT